MTSFILRFGRSKIYYTDICQLPALALLIPDL